MKRLLPLLLLAGCARPDPAVLDAGREAWTESCANCHFVPDPSGSRAAAAWTAMHGARRVRFEIETGPFETTGSREIELP